ncbi:HEPN domain-containing protein [Polynucleobacter sp. Fuers-14]|uniref:HEPN domain-containing protein n=1 Tax=Polynucleobacter sp. Fuers-14 TaxID=1758364 RepID=UPI001C0C3895|nr:HEPN domain-containing protein [Polynucleobacter sp. Fuers-14]
MKAKELFIKATTAAASEKILLNADDFDGACNRAYYAMFDAARGALLASGEVNRSSIQKPIVVSYQFLV